MFSILFLKYFCNVLFVNNNHTFSENYGHVHFRHSAAEGKPITFDISVIIVYNKDQHLFSISYTFWQKIQSKCTTNT